MGKAIDGTLVTDEEDDELTTKINAHFDQRLRSLRFWFIAKFTLFIVITLGCGLVMDNVL